MSKQELRDLNKTLDKEQPRSLTGKFNTAILDEFHQHRDEGSKQSTAMLWLEASIHLSLTATPWYHVLAGKRVTVGRY